MTWSAQMALLQPLFLCQAIQHFHLPRSPLGLMRTAPNLIHGPRHVASTSLHAHGTLHRHIGAEPSRQRWSQRVGRPITQMYDS
ncbi:hypothetical protein EDB85DRAFT_1966819 [Lactarius pseudohatsudake]|nr:hypothetical protein EDB85DRAFT_1966819 [Lactarius pseudohatsudake]